MTAPNITADEFTQRVLNADTLVLVDFWANWCRPCKMLAPILDRFALNTHQPVQVVKMDIEASAEIAEIYSIKSAPTLMLFDKGKVRSTKRGMMSERQLDKWISETLDQ